jgi:hypothetical protein
MSILTDRGSRLFADLPDYSKRPDDTGTGVSSPARCSTAHNQPLTW